MALSCSGLNNSLKEAINENCLLELGGSSVMENLYDIDIPPNVPCTSIDGSMEDHGECFLKTSQQCITDDNCLLTQFNGNNNFDFICMDQGNNDCGIENNIESINLNSDYLQTTGLTNNNLLSIMPGCNKCCNSYDETLQMTCLYNIGVTVSEPAVSEPAVSESTLEELGLTHPTHQLLDNCTIRIYDTANPGMLSDEYRPANNEDPCILSGVGNPLDQSQADGVCHITGSSQNCISHTSCNNIRDNIGESTISSNCAPDDILYHNQNCILSCPDGQINESSVPQSVSCNNGNLSIDTIICSYPHKCNDSNADGIYGDLFDCLDHENSLDITNECGISECTVSDCCTIIPTPLQCDNLQTWLSTNNYSSTNCASTSLTHSESCRIICDPSSMETYHSGMILCNDGTIDLLQQPSCGYPVLSSTAASTVASTAAPTVASIPSPTSTYQTPPSTDPIPSQDSTSDTEYTPPIESSEPLQGIGEDTSEANTNTEEDSYMWIFYLLIIIIAIPLSIYFLILQYK